MNLPTPILAILSQIYHKHSVCHPVIRSEECFELSKLHNYQGPIFKPKVIDVDVFNAPNLSSHLTFKGAWAILTASSICVVFFLPCYVGFLFISKGFLYSWSPASHRTRYARTRSGPYQVGSLATKRRFS